MRPHPPVAAAGLFLPGLAGGLLLLLSALGAFAQSAPIAAGYSAPERPAFTAKELRQGYSDRTVIARPRRAGGGARAVPDEAALDLAETRERLRLRRRFAEFDALRVLEIESGETAGQVLSRLRASGRYEHVEFDRILRASTLPNDPRFDQQWALRNQGGSGGRVGVDIAAPAAWDVITDAPAVVVAVMDSGARLTHPDLAPNLWRNPYPTPGLNDLHGIRVINGRISGLPIDDNGHGTHVAGIIGAVGNNGVGMTGVAWRVQLMILKFLGADGYGLLSDELFCLSYAIYYGAHIINASYGETENAPQDPRQVSMIARARDAGIIYVAAAGNHSANMDLSRHYPASNPLDNIVAVAASTRLEDRATFSNYGSGAVELFAPGEAIVSLHYASDVSVVMASGTSMAAPVVSGALALMKTRFPTDTYRQLINRLLRSTEAAPAYAGRCQTGGRLNLQKAVTGTDNRPFNDDFADRAHLVGDNIATRGSNVGATAEAGETAGASLWWEWTAPVSANVNLDTAGSNYDTRLTVATGAALTSLTEVAANDDESSTVRTSRLTFRAVAGTTYQISVDGKDGAQGPTLLNVGIIPENDNLATAAPLTGRSVVLNANNAQTSREPDEPRILNSPGGRSLWFRWTAPASGPFQVSLLSDDLDPLLAVYSAATGNPGFSGLSPLSASETLPADEGTTNLAHCDFVATAGATYFISVDAKPGYFGVPTGQFTLTLSDAAWQVPTGDNITSSPAVGPDGTVYVGSNDGRFYAFNPDGSVKWATPVLKYLYFGYEYSVSMDTSSAAIAPDGTVYFGASDGIVRAYTAAGAPKWTFEVPAPEGPPRYASIYNAPALAADGTIYIKADDFRVYALDPATGAKKWSFDTGGLSYASPVVGADGTIYVGSDAGRFYALTPEGAEKWRFTTDGPIYATASIDAAGNLYFATSGDSCYSLTPEGTQRWRYQVGLAITSSPTLSADGRTAYFGAYDHKLHAVDTATGVGRWTYPLGDEVRASSPAIDANGVIYIGSYDYRVHAVNPDGTLLRTFATGRWVRSSPVIAGNRLYFGSNDHKLHAYDLPTTAAAGPWPQLRHNPRRLGRAVVDPFAFAATPESQTAVLGEPLSLKVAVTGAGVLFYQWSRNGVALPGATNATYTVSAAGATTGGSYTATVRGDQGTLTSPPAVVSLEARNPGRLVNLSVRTTAGAGAQLLTVGFAVAGEPAKPILLRAIGPTLSSFGVAGAMSDPLLQLYSGPAVIARNDDWSAPESGTPQSALAAAFAASGAFALLPNTKDAALLRPMATGSFTAEVSASGTAPAGIILAELYDTAPTAGARLVNVSARAQVSSGGDPLVAGFSVNGNLARRVLIRAIGPTLGAFGVTGALGNPRLDLYRGSTLLQSNDNWGFPSVGGATATTLRAAFASVGAFPLEDPFSYDAALLAIVPPGSYTVQVSGVNDVTGVALIEIYELP